MSQRWYMKSDEDKSMFCALLVDANANYREALTDILYAYFPLIDVVEAGNGAEALGKVEYYRPSIIFMDTQLADKSGLDLIKDIKLICGNIVIVILSNNNLPEYLHLAFSYGADYYIPKREDNCMEEILSQIDAAMAIRPDH